MSVILCTEVGWIIDQQKFINSTVKTVSDNGILKSFAVNPNLFNINTQFLRPNQLEHKDFVTKYKNKKRFKKDNLNSNYDSLCLMNRLVETRLALLIDKAQQLGLFNKSSELEKDRNQSAKLVANNFYEKTSSINFLKYSNGGNNSNENLLVNIDKEKYIIPANCRFYCQDIRDIKQYLDCSAMYDLILLDPPWWNKHIRRKKSQGVGLSYTMLENSELLAIPIQSLLKPNGIVLIWCTNAPSHLKYVENVLFPEWNLTKVATWYWIKITKEGVPVCNFSTPPAKQPFEQIIFGRSKSNNAFNSKIIPDQKIIASIPSALHSHKPNLTEILLEFLSEEPKYLELFARTLQNNWTSYGFEPLRLQHISFFEEIST